MDERSYRVALAAAIILHVCIMSFLFYEPVNKQPVLTLATKPQPTASSIHSEERVEDKQAIKAVSISHQEVMDTVNRLKKERQIEKEAELKQQQELKKLADNARQNRLKEQQRLAELKKEAEKLAKAQKQQVETEKKRLKQLAEQKKAEEQRLVELKKKQLALKKEQEEAVRIAEEKRKQAEAQAKAKREAEALAKAQAKAQAEAERKKQQAIEAAAREAEKNARIAGEVDKYKALIINAISRQWILPDNVNSNLSSQFRIRLAPTGAVLEISLTRSSGDPVLDRSAQAAIYKASPLPVPSEPDAFNVFRDISLTVRPENARG